MDEIDIVMKHLRAMGELKPEKPPKAPKKPKEPKAPDLEKVTPAKQKNYDKRMATYSEKLKKYNSEYASYKRAFDNWELIESRKKALVSQVKLKEDGTLIGGSPHRAFMLTDFENEMELDYFIGGTGEKYPNNMERFFPDLSGGPLLTITEVQGFRKFCQTVAPVTENARVTIESGKWTFYPDPYDRDPAFESASWAIDYDGETVEFGIDPEKLTAMFMLFEKLKVKKADLHFVSPVRPMTFVTDRGKYLICPVRIH